MCLLSAKLSCAPWSCSVAFISNNPGPVNLAEGAEAQPSVEERRALIDRVARSEQFSRSARLRDFLLYVGKQSLKEGCPEINEQEIGHKVFGRPLSYDRSQDNIVRVNATELRRRIESYFAADGAHEPLIIEIPRGHYKPIFRWRTEADSDHPHPVAAEFPATVQTRKAPPAVVRKQLSRALIHSLWASACLLLAIACAWLGQQNQSMQKELHPWQARPALNAFWGDFFHNNSQTDIVLPDDSVTVIEGLSNRSTTLAEYTSHDFMHEIHSMDLSADRMADLNDIFGHNLITYGAVAAALKLIDLDPSSSNFHLTAARFYGPDALKRNNVILLGGKKANPWVYLFDDQLNFDLQAVRSSVVVVNHHPLANEQPVYGESATDKGPAGYVVIAFLPNPSRTRNTIIVAGTDSDSTNAGAEFLTSEDQLERLRNLFHTDRIPYFEALLRTSQLTGTSFNSEIVAYRTYPGLH